MLTILPTSRSIRSLILKDRDQDGFLPSYITISEFLQRAIVVDGYSRVDEDTRTLMLLEASDFKNFQSLQIERNFFTFTQNSSYIFRFFEELSGELIDIDSLVLADTYGDYEEHIEILYELYLRYEKLCEEKKVLDPIFIAKNYKLNYEYISSIDEIMFVAEGYLTNFELQVLIECAKLTELKIRFFANTFNTKMQDKFLDLGIEIIKEKNQIINLSKKIIEKKSSVNSVAKIVCESFSQRILQVAFVKKKIAEYVESGIEAQNIVVIVPDENFALHLRQFDEKCNLNFAMGQSLRESTFMQALSAVTEYLDNKSVQNRERINRIGAELIDSFSKMYKASIECINFKEILLPFIELEKNKMVLKIIDEELFFFEKLLPILKDSTLKSALHLFTNRLSNRTTDDIRGGKITVMGVLETRSISYEGVIIVDFNEGIVPRKSEKDLFLNSATRRNAGLPSSKDREALQKLYYNNLFLRAKQISISYVESADKVASRFLTQLGIQKSISYDESEYSKILFSETNKEQLEEKEIVLDYNFSENELSATGLKTFLTCKRKFYNRYIQGLKEHEIEQDLAKEHEIGTALHLALKNVYEKKNRYIDIVELRKDISIALKENSNKTILDKYLFKMWMQRLEPFLDNEIQRFKEVEVKECEISLKKNINGVTIVGNVDRIDNTLNGLEVLDYKSGSFPKYTSRTVEKADDFQLEFYYLLAQDLGEVNACGYYDLKNGKIINEDLLEVKLELLYEHLEVLKNTKTFNFEKTENLTNCDFCPYTYLCNR